MRCRIALVPALFLLSCGPSTESRRTDSATPTVATKETLYQQGHRFYLQRQLDSAHALLSRAVTMDPNYRDALADLAPLQYDLAMREPSPKTKTGLLRNSRDTYMKLESLGVTESDIYERLCEIATALNDDKTFLKFAKRNAEQFPYDRQYYNLTVAYFNVEDYTNAIKVCKEAIEKFPSSPFIGTYYRQLGRAYMKVDRDQTAEKTFYAGLSVIDNRIAELRKTNPAFATSDEYARFKDDKIGILISLKNLHTTYKALDKLANVERKLKELGK